MSLKEKINNDIKEAMKAKDADRLSTLRMVMSVIKNAEIEKRVKDNAELTDEEVVKIMRKENKKREESVATYTAANRPELAASEKKEIEIIGSYLPAEMGEAQVRELVQKAIAGGAKDIKGVMAAVRKVDGGLAPGKLVSDIAKELLAK